MTHQLSPALKVALGTGLVVLLILAATSACTTPPPSTVVIDVTATPTITPTPTSTPLPTNTPTPTLIPTPTVTPTPPPSSVLLETMNYQPQTYNNCGPCSIAIILGHYDHWITQYQVNEQVAAGPSVCDIADHVSQYGLQARAYECPPSRDPVRLLLANGIPVIANQLLEIGSDIGHYRVVKGYDDVAQEFISDDPLQSKGPDYHISYSIFTGLSRHGAIIPVYPPEMDLLVQSLMREMGAREIVYCPP